VRRPEVRGLTLPVVLLAGVLVIAGGLLVALTWDMTFYQDTWGVLMTRRDPSVDSILLPHNEHIVVFPVLLEQALVRMFGMTSAQPEYLLSIAALLGTAALLFVYLRRRVGDWLALFAVTLVLFLGPAWEVLLWPFEISFVASVFFGLAALLAIEREERRWDLAACLFLVGAAGFSSLGIPLMAGAAVAIAAGPSGARMRRAYVAAIPLLLFGAWFLGWGHESESHISLSNALESPVYVVEAIVVNAGSALGLNPDPTSEALGRGPNQEAGLDPVWGWVVVIGLVIALAAAFAVRRRRGAPLSRSFWPAATIAFANWFLTALNYFPGREPTNSRYQYAGAIFALMALAALFDGFRPQRRAVVVAGAVAVLAVVPHLVVLGNGADFLEEQSVLTRADTAALEIARSTVDPGFQLTDEVAGTPTLPNVYAGQYFTAIDEYGSPAYTLAELRTAPAAGRFQADIVLTYALPIAITTEPGEYESPDSECMVMPPGEKPEVALAPGTTAQVEIAPGPEAGLRLRRFASGEYPVNAGPQPGGSVSELTIPADASPLRWHLLVEAEQRVRVCA
jgi:hypothetical protein